MNRKHFITAIAFVSSIILLAAFQSAALAEGAQPTPTPAASAPPSSLPAPEFKRTLQSGCRGDDVEALQARLAELGFYKSDITGYFGSATKSAVKAFQKAHGMYADGVVGAQSFASIFGIKLQFHFYRMKITNGSDERSFLLKKGNTGDDVEDLQRALAMKGFYNGKINGVFDAKTKTAVIRFQRTIRNLKADGLAGNYTLACLYTLLNPPDMGAIQPWPAGVDPGYGIPIEKLDWEYVYSDVFARGMDMAVVDVRTGYIINARFVGGHNHADVEPITALDAATFFKAAGGFSWDRRPVWVLVQGRRLAASMNCMPHGYDTIPGNDFVGQFCIHFVGSRGHGSNKVDPAHQACIEEAYQAALTMMPSATPTPTPSPAPTPEATPSPDPSPASGVASAFAQTVPAGPIWRNSRPTPKYFD